MLHIVFGHRHASFAEWFMKIGPRGGKIYVNEETGKERRTAPPQGKKKTGPNAKTAMTQAKTVAAKASPSKPKEKQSPKAQEVKSPKIAKPAKSYTGIVKAMTTEEQKAKPLPGEEPKPANDVPQFKSPDDLAQFQGHDSGPRKKIREYEEALRKVEYPKNLLADIESTVQAFYARRPSENIPISDLIDEMTKKHGVSPDQVKAALAAGWDNESLRLVAWTQPLYWMKRPDSVVPDTGELRYYVRVGEKKAAKPATKAEEEKPKDQGKAQGKAQGMQGLSNRDIIKRAASDDVSSKMRDFEQENDRLKSIKVAPPATRKVKDAIESILANRSNDYATIPDIRKKVPNVPLDHFKAAILKSGYHLTPYTKPLAEIESNADLAIPEGSGLGWFVSRKNG